MSLMIETVEVLITCIPRSTFRLLLALSSMKVMRSAGHLYKISIHEETCS